MAFSNVDIFNMTPKTDCKECGASNCRHFSYRVYQGVMNILACPYISRESLAAAINGTVASIDTDRSKDGDTRHILGENMVCPDCKNKIEEDMKFCPFCGKKTPEKKVEVEEVFISDTNKTIEVFQEEDLEIYDLNEISGAYLGEGLELIDLYTQNKNDQTYQEEKVEEAIFSDTTLKEEGPKILDFYSGNEDMVCPDCKNKIEEDMKFCSFCGKKIPEKKVGEEEVFIPDSTGFSGTYLGEWSGLIDFCSGNENMVCPNCGNDIEEGMDSCPFCDEKIPEKKEDVEGSCVSDANAIDEARVLETYTLHEIYEKKKTLEEFTSCIPDDDNVIFQEERAEETTTSDIALQEESPKILDLYSDNEKMVCPDCKNKIEENMKFCPFCGKKIPEKEVRIEEAYVSDINEVDGASVNDPTLSDPTGASADIQEEILMAGSVPVPNRSEDTDNKEILKERKITKMDEKDRIDKKWGKKTPIEKLLTVSVYIFWIAVIWFVWKSWSTSYTYIVDHLMYDNSVEYINTLLEDNYCKDIDIPRYRKKYIYHSGRGENTSEYNDIPNKYSNNFYEYCTVTLPVEYREVNGKEVSEEMMIEFHVFKPFNYESMELEDIHIINLTKKNFDELKENLNELESGDFNLDDLNWDY